MGSLESDNGAIQDVPTADEAGLNGDGIDPIVALSRFRYRIGFRKDGPLRYTSQLDLARIWERVLRRAGLPLVYSQGFNPRPRIQLAVGLPLGYASQCEIVDVWLEADVAISPDLVSRINEAAPTGLLVNWIETVDARGPALQSIVTSVTYQVAFRDRLTDDNLTERVTWLLAQSSVMKRKKDKAYDLRPLIDKLNLIRISPPLIEMTLAASAEKGTARPDEVLEALGLDAANAIVVRTALHFDSET